MNDQVKQQIESTIKGHKVVLFMKGNRSFPQCGFSAQVVQILNKIVPQYETVNVLADAAIREGIKEFSQWPTIPQLYVDGEFVGGCDIVKAMNASGELQALFGIKLEPVKAPTITISAAAKKALSDALTDIGAHVLRFEASDKFAYELYFDEKQANDVVATVEGLSIHMTRDSASRLDGASIDFVDGPGGSGFKISSPHEPARVKQLSAPALKAMLDGGDKVVLLDVRTVEEHATASIKQAHLVAKEPEFLKSLDRNRTIVVHCHHGGRSQRAAEQLVADGFKNVYNLEGGIDAWSQAVDPSVPRY